MALPVQHRIEFRTGGPADVTVTTAGEADLNGFRRLNDDLLTHPCFRSGLRILVDHSHLDTSTLSDQDIQATGKSVAELADRFGAARIAVVAPGPAAYAASRASADSLGPFATPIRAKVFATRDEAEAWLWEGTT
jgi:hypothetical protein